MGFFKTTFLSIVVLFGAVLIGVKLQKRVDIPSHLLGHPAIFTENLFTKEEADKLMKKFKSMPFFRTNAADLKSYTTKHEHIGEAQDLVNGVCEHPFLIPNGDRTKCILPGRVDVARHFVMHGGVPGLKEWYEDLISRVQSFGSYHFDPNENELIQELFASENFNKAAKDICPKNKQVLDSFQYNYILQIPGQSVALHLDAVYFWGASRFQFPQWLLAAMSFSGMWKDRYIDQIQLVGYVHQWSDPHGARGGRFVYWNTEDQAMHSVPATPRAGINTDGAKVAHAADVYMPGVKTPFLDKGKDNRLVYLGDDLDLWELRTNGQGIRNYTTDDLRMTLVIRARCFASEEEKERYHNQKDSDNLTLDQILDTFKNDLVTRGKLSEEEKKKITPLDLAMLILDTYVKYPLPPTAHIPYNYCAAAKMFPALKPVLAPFCDTSDPFMGVFERGVHKEM